MALIIGAALAVLSVAVIMYPFLKPRVRTGDHGGVSAVDPAATEVEPVYDAIRTLQLEYQLGKVPENLYLEQLAGYRLQAAGVLRQRAAQRTGYDEWLLEQKVLLARTALRAAADGPQKCPRCGATVGASLAACAECGANLDTEARVRG